MQVSRDNSPIYNSLSHQEIKKMAGDITEKLLPFVKIYNQEMKVLRERDAKADRALAQIDKTRHLDSPILFYFCL